MLRSRNGCAWGRAPRCSCAGPAFTAQRGSSRSTSFSRAPSQPVRRHGMPRLDFFRSLHPGLDPFATDGMTRDPDSPEDPSLRSYRSGFWGIVEIGPARGAGAASWSCARGSRTAARRRWSSARLPRPRTRRPRRRTRRPRATPTAMRPRRTDPVRWSPSAWRPTTPPLELFAPPDRVDPGADPRNWVCVISDDCSSPERFAASRSWRARDDPRFVSPARPAGWAST